jgi:hypothetical protein
MHHRKDGRTLHLHADDGLLGLHYARTIWPTGPTLSVPSPRSPPGAGAASNSATAGRPRQRLAQAPHRRAKPAHPAQPRPRPAGRHLAAGYLTRRPRPSRHDGQAGRQASRELAATTAGPRRPALPGSDITRRPCNQNRPNSAGSEHRVSCPHLKGCYGHVEGRLGGLGRTGTLVDTWQVSAVHDVSVWNRIMPRTKPVAARRGGSTRLPACRVSQRPQGRSSG